MIGALELLGNGTGEAKSVRTQADYIRNGESGSLLERMIVEARGKGLSGLSFETGSSR